MFVKCCDIWLSFLRSYFVFVMVCLVNVIFGLWVVLVINLLMVEMLKLIDMSKLLVVILVCFIVCIFLVDKGWCLSIVGLVILLYLFSSIS